MTWSGKSEIVRSAIRVHGFRDPEFDYQLLRAMGVSAYGGSTVGECLTAVSRISDGSPASWSKAFASLAEHVAAEAVACREAGHLVSARNHFLRASTYFRAAEYYVDRVTELTARTGERSHECFSAAASLSVPPVEAIEIPFAGESFPGYFVRPSTGATPAGAAPVLVALGGFDSSAEELYFHYGVPGAERGWNVLLLDGPGQMGCMRTHPDLTFRPDYEAPVAAALDAVLARDDVDPDRVALAGQGLGGYFAVRAAAHDGRIRALIASSPIVDLFRYMEAYVGPSVFRMSEEIRPEDVTGIPEDLVPLQMPWGIEAVCRRFGSPSFQAWREYLAGFRVGDALAGIECPVLALAGEHEGQEADRQIEEFLAGVRGPGTLRRFTTDDGVVSHGQVDNLRLLAQVVFDWLDELFA